MQTEIDEPNLYTIHLYNDTVKGTREFEVKKLMDILGLIARVKDKIADVKNTSKTIYGTDIDGNILTDQRLKVLYIKNSELLKRLKQYYNNNISKLKPF